MDNKKKIILLCILVFMFALTIIFFCFDLFSNDEIVDVLLINKMEQDNTDNDGIYDNKNNEQEQDVEVFDKSGDSNLTSDSIVSDNTEDIYSSKENIQDNSESIHSEEDLVNYFENIGNEVEVSSSFKEKFKEYFINIIDFIFYDKEINGYTFDGLSGTAKAKIISIALKIDNKIEQYIPNYKESISGTGSKIYTSVKDKLIVLYMDISTDICDNNEDDCKKVKEIFSEVKDVCKIGWEFIKNLFKGGFSKVKDWYEVYSGK